MASTHTTRARLVAAAVRWFKQTNSATEGELHKRVREHVTADKVSQRWYDRARRETCIHTLNHGDMMDRTPCVRRAGHDGRHKNVKGVRWE